MFTLVRTGKKLELPALDAQVALRQAEAISASEGVGFEMFDTQGRVVASIAPQATSISPWAAKAYAITTTRKPTFV